MLSRRNITFLNLPMFSANPDLQKEKLLVIPCIGIQLFLMIKLNFTDIFCKLTHENIFNDDTKHSQNGLLHKVFCCTIKI